MDRAMTGAILSVAGVFLVVLVTGVLLTQGAGEDTQERFGWGSCQQIAGPLSTGFSSVFGRGGIAALVVARRWHTG